MNKFKDKAFIKENLGKTVKKYRLMYDLSIEELAKLLGLSSAFVGLIERGERGVSLKNLVRLSEIFDIDINQLIYDSSLEHKDRKLLGFSEPKETEEERKLRSLSALLTGLNAKELEYIIENVKSLKRMQGKEVERKAIQSLGTREIQYKTK